MPTTQAPYDHQWLNSKPTPFYRLIENLTTAGTFSAAATPA
ncbi:MAG TPA: hypothetical protein VMF06_19465 [Candidatus Limnocylindria bacterium]|jgi:hypothetical protein|nr:hypothetical protein [Candidatus Limnocylindria bacterium]